MAFTKIAAAGIGSTGTVTLENIVVTGDLNASSATISGNVSIAGTLTYEDVTNIDSIGIVTARSDVIVGAGLSVVGITTLASAGGITTTGGTLFTKQLNVSGVSTLGNTIVGGATTQLIVNGDARITGILTIGTSSITFDGNTDTVRIGTGVTITSGIVSATEFRGNGANLSTLNASNISSGTLPDARFPATLPAVSGANLTNIPGFVAGTLMLFQQTAAPTGWTKQTTHNDKTLRVVSGTASSGGSTAFTSVFASKTPTGSVSVSGSNSGGAVANQTAGGSVSGTNSSGSVSAHTLSTSEIPSHQHGLGIRNGNANLGYTSSADAFGQAAGGAASLYSNSSGFTSNTNIISASGGGGSHSHGFTNPTWSGTFTGSSHGHTFTNPTWSGSASFTGSALDFAVQYVDLIIASKD
jgi:hypothetical protein